VQVVSKSRDRALKLQTAASEKLPWDVAAMCKMVESDKNTTENSTSQSEGWKYRYAQYAWLCQIKHPTLTQSLHDAGSTANAENGYAVIVLPDVREEDLGVKKLVCFIALRSALDAIQSFASYAGIENTTDEGKIFSEKISKIGDLLTRQMKTENRLNVPFTIENSKWARKHMKKPSCVK